MKNYSKLIILTLSFMILSQTSKSQTKENPWSFGFAVNAVNIFSGGGDAPQGDFFDEYVNINDHFNFGFPQLSVSRYITKDLNLTVIGSANQITKFGQLPGDESVLTDKLLYLGADGMLSYDFGTLLNSEKFVPFIGVGGGVSWIEGGPFNTPESSETTGSRDLLGSGTVNGTVGLKYWITEGVGVQLQSTFKHAFSDNLRDHFQHSLGVVFNFGEIADNRKPLDSDEDGVPNDYDLCPDVAGLVEFGGCPDTDGDGIADKDDLCPSVAGAKAFAGCPDTDGDGFSDNLDKCPNVFGTDKGCPVKVKPEVKQQPIVEVLETTKKVYFDYNRFALDQNAKSMLDDIASRKSIKSYAITVNGNTDSTGSNSYNQKLSLKRANAVKDYLVSKGLMASKISVNALGESQPSGSNDTEAGRAQNRKSVVKIDITSN